MSIDEGMPEEVLVLGLDQPRDGDDDRLARSGRSARTLVKNGTLRATLVELASGGELAEHRAEGPITVQPLRGRIVFRAAGAEREVGPGQLLTLAAGVPHAVRSVDGARFLLTLSLAGH